MTVWLWVLVGVLAWLAVVTFVVLLMQGAALADRVEAPRVRVVERRPR